MYRYTNIQKFVTLMYLKEVSYALLFSSKHCKNSNIVKYFYDLNDFCFNVLYIFLIHFNIF